MAELYRRHGALVFRFTLRMSQDSNIAEEITQEVFLALLQRPDRFDPERAALSTWLCAIARRQLWKHFKSNERFVSIESDDPFDTVSPEPDPAEWLTRKEAVASVRGGLDQLPIPLKEIVVLCELEGLTYEQAAQILAIPIGTVRSRLSRARNRLSLFLRGAAICAGKENSQ